MCLLESWFSQGICPLVGFLGYMVVLFQVFKWMTPHPACDSAVVPCLHGFQAFLQSIPCGHIFSPVSSCHLSEVKSSPHPGITLQSLHSSSQPSHVLVDLRSCLGYVGSRPGLSVWVSIYSDCHISAASLSNSFECFPSVPTDCPKCGDLTAASASPPTRCTSDPAHSALLFSFLPSSYWVLCGSIYSFLVVRDSCQPQLVLHVIFCIWSSVFLIHPWREMCPLSTYFSAILSPSFLRFWIDFQLLTVLLHTGQFVNLAGKEVHLLILILGCILEQRILGGKLYSWWICKYLLPQLYLAVLKLLWKGK